MARPSEERPGPPEPDPPNRSGGTRSPAGSTYGDWRPARKGPEHASPKEGPRPGEERPAVPIAPGSPKP